MMIGRMGNSKRLIHLVDFGLSANFIKPDGSHISFKRNVGNIGTMRFNSINCHKVIKMYIHLNLFINK